ncbi:MAG: glycolate oxidase subunit GlcE, partial [Pseudomonadota bacterium]
VEGFAGSVAYRSKALADIFPGAEVTLDPDAVVQTWAAIRDVAALQGVPGDLWRVSVKPSDAPGVVARIAPDAVQYDWGGGLIWMVTSQGTDVRAALQVPGHATCLRGAAPVAALTAQLRARFDPRGIFNPGLMAA